jgi:hypothetical protein
MLLAGRGGDLGGGEELGVELRVELGVELRVELGVGWLGVVEGD